MNLNPITAAGKRLAKWLLPHILDEVQKEVERKAGLADPNTPRNIGPQSPGGSR
jgi:hypothetical protein